MERQKIELQQSRFLAHLLFHGTVEGACKASKIGKAKAYVWLKDPSFQKELSQRRGEMVDTAMELLQAASVAATETLRRLLTCGKEAVECRAAVAIIEAACKAKELAEIEQRIAALEALAKERSLNGQARETH